MRLLLEAGCRAVLVLALAALPLAAQDPLPDANSDPAPLPAPPSDPYCPAYPSALRTEVAQSLELDRQFTEFSRTARFRKRAAVSDTSRIARSTNFIDQAVFAQMSSDGVPPAPTTTDSEFLRRAYLDLSGRIPSPADAKRFIDDADPNKRANLIEALLAAPAYADQMALFLANRFKVTRAHDNISTPARNVFSGFLRQLFAQDTPYDVFVRQFLTASGPVDVVPGTQFFARWMDLNGPIQDSWDDITEKVTTGFLGYKTECISCHNGRAHLEKINLYLSHRTRSDFWKMSSFLSRMQFVRLSDDPIGYRPQVTVVDRAYGSYSGSVPVSNPGCRPARLDAVVTPVYFTDGSTPKSGNWRAELANLVTSDRQFAKATVNYLWSYFFGYGIVDPPDGWDLSRVDPNNPPPGDWPMQNSNPQLLEQMADALIQNGFHLKPLIRQIVNSETYQLSSRYEGQWQPVYVKYFARYQPRRLSAEQMYDALTTATHTEQPMTLIGNTGVATYANQLPDPTEPFSDYRVTDFLTQFGRGNWYTLDRTSVPTILGLLFMMNDSNNVYRSMGVQNSNVGITNRVHLTDAQFPNDTDAITQIFLATLSRYPTSAELNIMMQRRSGPRYQWLSDLQWALLNKLDFAFNY
jgi:hypothetical protein